MPQGGGGIKSILPRDILLDPAGSFGVRKPKFVKLLQFIAQRAYMSNVVPFRKPKPMEKARGKTMCREGFHKWIIWQDKQFDVKQGKLVTVYVCKRCGERKTVAH